jgi:A/G-specific adenine glycosylase
MTEFKKALHIVQRRSMPWRTVRIDGPIDPYTVLVSEIMLQQTSVERVTPKFKEFIRRFPSFEDLARARLSSVLKVWNGLGYNRRAKFLHQAAQTVVRNFGGILPPSTQELITLPGVGPGTAGAILAYAFNQPALFIETNIRTVYIHHFFYDRTDVPDTAILEYLDQTLDRHHPREFYWRLMDYGTLLKKEHGNLSRRARAYVKQSKFAGSKRQIRGQVLSQLATHAMTRQQLKTAITDNRLPDVLVSLQTEGLITKKKQHFVLG